MSENPSRNANKVFSVGGATKNNIQAIKGAPTVHTGSDNLNLIHKYKPPGIRGIHINGIAAKSNAVV
jgi:hypothetical protein